MSHADPLLAFRRRANRHALEDGVADLFAGAYAVIAGAATQRTTYLALAVVYLGVLASGWKFAHARVSTGRTGYAESVDQPQLAVLTGILASAVVSLAVVAAATLSQGRLWELSHWPTWAPVVAGVVLAAGFAHTALRSGLWRWGLYALASVAGGVAFWLLPFGARINPSDRLTLLLFSLGGLLILTGVVVVLHFTRTHPVVAEESGRGA